MSNVKRGLCKPPALGVLRSTRREQAVSHEPGGALVAPPLDEVGGVPDEDIFDVRWMIQQECRTPAEREGHHIPAS